MKKSINLLFGVELEQSGYKMLKVNNFSKKYKNFYFCVDKDIADHFVSRLLIKYTSGETKCIESEFFKDLTSYETSDFINLILNQEKKYLEIIEKR